MSPCTNPNTNLASTIAAKHLLVDLELARLSSVQIFKLHRKLKHNVLRATRLLLLAPTTKSTPKKLLENRSGVMKTSSTTTLLQSFLSILVIDFLLLRISQHFIGSRNFLNKRKMRIVPPHNKNKP
jgi:hypothetical protein